MINAESSDIDGLGLAGGRPGEAQSLCTRVFTAGLDAARPGRRALQPAITPC